MSLQGLLKIGAFSLCVLLDGGSTESGKVDRNYKSILRQVEGGLLHIDEYYDPQTKRLNGSWRIDCNGSVVASLTPYSVRIYSADEFKQMAKEVGFRDIEVCGSFDRSKFTPDSKELIIIAKK